MSAPAQNNGGQRRIPDWPARNPVMPSLVADATGPLSMVEHNVSEQYLDSSLAGKIAPHRGHDLPLEKSNPVKPPSVALAAKAKRTAPLLPDSIPPARHGQTLKAGLANWPKPEFAGRAGRARKTAPLLGMICGYSPPSWHHEKGIYKVIRKLQARLPDVSGMLFHTYTFDRNFFSSPAVAFEHARPKIRKVYARLRKGVRWQGKFYQINAPYCVKVEFHADEDGWPHFHVILLTRRYIPGDLLDHLWGLGRVNVKRITNDDFIYLLKYATKRIGYPPWVLTRCRIRIFQASHGFLKAADGADKPKTKRTCKAKRPRASYTIGERLYRWERMALFNKNGRCQTIVLPEPFQTLFDELVYSIAEEWRYLGLGLIKINHTIELLPWVLKLNLT